MHYYNERTESCRACLPNPVTYLDAVNHETQCGCKVNSQWNEGSDGCLCPPGQYFTTSPSDEDQTELCWPCPSVGFDNDNAKWNLDGFCPCKEPLYVWDDEQTRVVANAGNEKGYYASDPPEFDITAAKWDVPNNWNLPYGACVCNEAKGLQAYVDLYPYYDNCMCEHTGYYLSKNDDWGEYGNDEEDGYKWQCKSCGHEHDDEDSLRKGTAGTQYMQELGPDVYSCSCNNHKNIPDQHYVWDSQQEYCRAPATGYIMQREQQPVDFAQCYGPASKISAIGVGFCVRINYPEGAEDTRVNSYFINAGFVPNDLNADYSFEVTRYKDTKCKIPVVITGGSRASEDSIHKMDSEPKCSARRWPNVLPWQWSEVIPDFDESRNYHYSFGFAPSFDAVTTSIPGIYTLGFDDCDTASVEGTWPSHFTIDIVKDTCNAAKKHENTWWAMKGCEFKGQRVSYQSYNDKYCLEKNKRMHIVGVEMFIGGQVAGTLKKFTDSPSAGYQTVEYVKRMCF